MPTAMLATPDLKPSLKRKRDLDSTPSASPSSSSPVGKDSKKPRVTIALPEESMTSTESNRKDDAFEESVTKANVHDALEQLESSNPEPFNELCARIALPSSSPEALSSNQLRFILRALTSEISRLDSIHCQGIISAILKVKWSQRDSLLASAYARFLAVLVSSIPRWWSEVAKKIVGEFVLKDTTAHHSLLEYIFKITPLATNGIQQVFISNFPHKSDSAKRITRYVDNILLASEYCPDLKKGVWALILEKVVQLDVELDELDEELEDLDDSESESEPEEEEAIAAKSPEKQDVYSNRQGDDNDDDEDSDGDSEDDNDGEEISEYEMQPDETKNLAAVRNKLDAVMTLLMKHLHTKFTTETVESEEALPMFQMHLDLFREYVLPTHRTRSVQYLMFKICHSHPQLLDRFLVSMIRAALDNRNDLERRQKAMQYVSSFVARAKGLSKQQIVTVVHVLRNWLQHYIQEREVEVEGESGGMGRFRMFYCTAQALFYIFCFRHSSLRRVEDSDGAGEWECNLDKLFQHMIVTKFNPLKYCKQTIVAMFARIAQKEDAAYCFTIMEQNRVGGFSRSVGSSNSSRSVSVPASSFASSLSNTLWNKNDEFVALEGYFPFDPIVLPNANGFVENIYVEWDDEEHSDSGSEDYDDDEGSDSDTDIGLEVDE